MAGMDNVETKSPVELAITKAVMRAARLLKFEQALLARILGVNAPTASRMIAGH